MAGQPDRLPRPCMGIDAEAPSAWLEALETVWVGLEATQQGGNGRDSSQNFYSSLLKEVAEEGKEAKH